MIDIFCGLDYCSLLVVFGSKNKLIYCFGRKTFAVYQMFRNHNHADLSDKNKEQSSKICNIEYHEDRNIYTQGTCTGGYDNINMALTVVYVYMYHDCKICSELILKYIAKLYVCAL